MRERTWGGQQRPGRAEWQRCKTANRERGPTRKAVRGYLPQFRYRRRFVTADVEQRGEDLARRDAVCRGVMQGEGDRGTSRQAVKDAQLPQRPVSIEGR